jgi:radical SAM superfamily enzyme YgiQ (UPF0313 family)
MNISLIIPPSPFLLDEKVVVNLGILKVGAMLKKQGHIVNVIDLSGNTNYRCDVIVNINKFKPDIIGFTSTTQQFPFVVNISKEIREHFPHIKQMIGGTHPTLVYASMKRKQERAPKNWKAIENYFDIIVAGDGELAVFEGLDRMNETPPIIIDADKTSSPHFLTNQQFNEFPWPDRSLIDMDSYHFYVKNRRATSLIAQLGCPFACGFCSGRTSPMLRKIRLRTSDSVIQELLHIHETYKYTGYMFYDDELNVNPSMIELLDKLIDIRNKGFDFAYRGCIKSELFTDAQAKKMAEAGFDELLVGFESGSDRILTNINKKSTKADNERCVELARKYGLRVKFLMSIGHPGESPETCQDTMDWLLKMQPDFFNITIITCTPGMFYYDYAVQTDKGWTYTAASGDKLHTTDLDYTKISDYYNGIPGKYNSFVFTDTLSSNDLIKWRDSIESNVRSKFKLPYYTKAEASYDKSMGQ